MHVWKWLRNGFNRINSGRSIPTTEDNRSDEFFNRCFNRINSGRSIPTLWDILLSPEVSVGFNRINSGRSIPTEPEDMKEAFLAWCFNRINSGRSIPTSYAKEVQNDIVEVSIVSIQADQSRQLPLGSQSWRGSQRLNGGTYFFNRKK